MDSSVDMQISPSSVHITKPSFVSSGFGICRLKSGKLAFTAHLGRTQVVFGVTEDECRRFISDLQELLDREHGAAVEPAPVEEVLP